MVLDVLLAVLKARVMLKVVVASRDVVVVVVVPRVAVVVPVDVPCTVLVASTAVLVVRRVTVPMGIEVLVAEAAVVVLTPGTVVGAALPDDQLQELLRPYTVKMHAAQPDMSPVAAHSAAHRGSGCLLSSEVHQEVSALATDGSWQVQRLAVQPSSDGGTYATQPPVAASHFEPLGHVTPWHKAAVAQLGPL
jgi:hypothetical protein